MTIATRKITTFLKTISALADTPSLGSSALLKAWFDSSPEELRLEINGLIDDLLAVAPGASGADNIGSAPIAGVTGATVYAQLSSLKTLLNNASNILATGNPNTFVTPTAIGQIYIDRTSGLVYTSTALTNTSWIIQTPYSSMTQQAIINAAMEVWQQGTTFTNPANNAYTADMFACGFSNSGTLPTTIVHSQATLTTGELFNSKYAYNINVNGAGSGFGATDYYRVHQRIEFGTSKLCGNAKKVTFSFYAKSNIAGKRIAVGLRQLYGTGGSPTAAEILQPTATTIRALTSTMALYTCTFQTNTLTGKTFGTNNDDYLEVSIYEMWGSNIAPTQLGGGTAETFVGSGDIIFTQVVVNAGDVALPFQPKSVNDELIACQRYYEKSYAVQDAPGSVTSSGSVRYCVGVNTLAAGNYVLYAVTYKVQKRVSAPTVTYYDMAGALGKITTMDASAIQTSGITPTFTPNNLSNGIFVIGHNQSGFAGLQFHWISDARL